MSGENEILGHFKGVIDSTLREGLQFSKADFSPREQRRIFGYLARIGVDYVEVGNPSQDRLRDIIRSLVRARRPGGPKILAHIRNHPEDVDRAVGIGVDGINILCTVDGRRIASFGLTFAEYARRLEGHITAAKRRGLEVRVGVEDAFGQDPEAGMRIYETAVAAGADRLAAADTLGRSLSWEVYRRIRTLKRRFPIDLEVHFHNDLGHAVSNALVALRAGANWISTSLLGLGERTGITPLSSLLANIYILDPTVAGRYRLRWLTPAETNVARICGIDMPPHLMTNRGNGFAHKAGIHLDALVKFGPRTYECLSPNVLGNRRHLIVRSVVSGKTTPADVRAFEKRFAGGLP